MQNDKLKKMINFGSIFQLAEKFWDEKFKHPCPNIISQDNDEETRVSAKGIILIN